MSSPPQSYKNGLVQYGQGSHEVPKAPENPENPQPNFRRQTSTRSASTSYSSRYNRSDSRDPSPQNGFENKSVECITIDGISAVEIRSTHLLGAIKKVSQRSQLQPILDSFTEQEPYPVLFDCLDDVEREVTQMNSEDATDDLKLLHSFIDYVYPIWNEAREEKPPNELVKYGMIWKYFRPGDLVLRKDNIGNLWLFVLIQIIYYKHQSEYEDEEEKKETIFDTWSLVWDEVDGCLVRKYATFTCDEFHGQKHIKSLPVYPIHDEKEIHGENIEKFLAERGRKWWDLIAAPSTCHDHDGLAYAYMRATGEKFRSEGRVVIDHISKRLPNIDDIIKNGRNISKHYRDMDDLRNHYRWDGLFTSVKLTDEQAMLCPAVIGCHDLKSKDTYTVGVSDLQPVKWNKDAMDHLVLDTKKKDMLKGLVRYHSSRNRHNDRGHPIDRGDLIAGKGQSLVILLHGPPGVGKTLTAESTAEAVGKPLIAMSIGEMVWDETQLQERLKAEFQRAVDWDAILLLDEADVVLEARSFEDVRRNGIVSIFLRELEYYQGILILTTNRVNTMDVAFQSRIQIGLGFKSMSPEIRAKVWKQLLTLNGRDKIIGPDALKKVQRELSKYELNGRQIRNALNVAEGLAFQEYGEGGKLTYGHIKEAAKAAEEFQMLLGESKSTTKLEQSVWAPYNGGDDDSVL